MDFHRRTWVEVNPTALSDNVAEIRRLAPDKEIIAVVKANAYGHGDDIICTQLTKLGIRHFAVSCIDEAVNIKKYAGDGEILIFGFVGAAYLHIAAENGFILTAGDLDYARELSAYISPQNMKFRVHVKLNTGMNRVGINTEAELEEVLRLPGLQCEAVYTHFPSADSPLEDDVSFTRAQQEKLLAFASGKGLKTHSQNSGGVLFHGDFEGDYVRAGLILYGLSPDPRFKPKSDMKLSPVMSLKSVICQLRTLEAGDPVSYGRTYSAPGKRLAAVVPAGYADGYSRAHSNSGLVSVKDTLCPVLGRVCMDQIIIDVSEVEGVRVGDEVLLYSANHKETSIDYIAEKLGTIPYEVVCAVSHRVRRIPASPASPPR
jgi:alanine racemase